MTQHDASIESVRSEAIATLESASEDGLDSWRASWLGRQDGRITSLLRSVKDQPPESRASFGAAANALKNELESALAERQDALKKQKLQQLSTSGAIDVTLPGRPQPVGRLHPVTQTMRDLVRVFGDMGFRVAEGPEVEWDRYNFDGVRIPEDHPARDMWDTIWVDSIIDGKRSMLLRTHTSPNQVRVMERMQPPIRVVVPGKCYRQEATDATHEWMLTQIEGLAVGEGVRMSDLKGTLYEFTRRMFGRERKISFHHSYFPFVEPGIEMAVDWPNPDGTTRWVEILGAGMVHPEVLENAGYDPDRYTGFAFGIGVERVAMLRWGIEDIRHFYQNDLRFLRQF